MKKPKTIKNNTAAKTVNKKNTDTLHFPIVGIGASAGGLETLEEFLENVPKNSGLAFVVIQHLDPTHVGMMPELLQRATQMQVKQVTDKLLVKPNHVYVIPPNKSMSILNGYLYLFNPVEKRGLRLPVDYFFRSLAADQQDNSIGIILSGMGSDGSLGVKAIKEQNGIVAIQEPSTAKYDSMPASAANAVVVDISAPVNQLPNKLIAILKHSPAFIQKTEIDDISRNNLGKVMILLRNHTGHDFSMYKKNTLYRRIERRMNVHQIDIIENYVRFLQENPHELDILFKELLIGVTNFFRDVDVWEKLREKILPELFDKLPNGYILRAWVTACSTGEEAYSLAIIFKEAYEKVKQNKNLSLQIFATDIDSDAIDRGRKGFFNANIVTDVSSDRLSKFFVKEDDGFRVNTSIREMVVFAPQNVIKDPPFTKMDLVLCRNLLIYMESELQNKLMNLFHYALNQEGIMLLGISENHNSQKNMFTTIDPKLKLYQRSESSTNIALIDIPGTFRHNTFKSNDTIKPIKESSNIQTITDQLVLQRFAPASVLINTDGDILYITGSTGKYLEPAAGKANMNIYAMAREGLQNELPSAIRKAKLSSEPIKLHKLEVGTNSQTQFVDITLQRIEKPKAIQGTIMIIFNDIPKPSKRKLKTRNQKASIREQELENELQHANEELQSTREEKQTTQEELKSTNEEMQSTNEELQSTNEELTTSKEEMQSLNEELQTVNNELQSKIADYVAANNDMKNLLNSTDIATLFLDKELNIRRFTEQTTKLFKLRQSDIGRPFTEIVNKLHYPEIANHANEVLRTLIYKETEIATNDQRWFTIRIMPYRTVDDHIDGLVITFIDNTQQKMALKNLHALKSNFERTLQNVNIILAICDTELRYTWVFNQTPGIDTKNLIGKRDNEIDNNKGASEMMKLKKQVLDTGKPKHETILFPVKDKIVSYHIAAQPIRDKNGDVSGVSTCASECVCEKETSKAKRS